ncbi:MAG: phosphoglycerate kinase [Salinirussus sp.]
MSYRTIDDLADGQRLLVRLDLNSPVSDGRVRDNRRFARHARTLRTLVDRDHAVVVLAHQGRPARETFISLDQHADILAEHLGQRVGFVTDTYGPAAIEAVRELGPGEVLLLENVRTALDELADETSPDGHARSGLVGALAPEVDAYVNDAYSVAHREHASLVGFPQVLEAYAGPVMVAEYEANSAIARRSFDGEVTMVAGGTKVTDVVEVLSALGDRVDNVLLGGIAGELFLRAMGHDVGRDAGDDDLYASQWTANRDRIRRLVDTHPGELLVPTDLAYEDDGERAEVSVAEARPDADYLDVGSATARRYADVAADSAAVFVKGALGVFEDERFSRGTVTVLEAIAACDCFSVVGGGDTSRAVDMYGLRETDFSHVSIAGGAYISALTGEPLPGVEALRTSAGAETCPETQP